MLKERLRTVKTHKIAITTPCPVRRFGGVGCTGCGWGFGGWTTGFCILPESAGEGFCTVSDAPGFSAQSLQKSSPSGISRPHLIQVFIKSLAFRVSEKSPGRLNWGFASELVGRLDGQNRKDAEKRKNHVRRRVAAREICHHAGHERKGKPADGVAELKSAGRSARAVRRRKSLPPRRSSQP